MNMGSRSRIAVLRGGPSVEFDLSMGTGTLVLNVLKNTNYIVEDIIITKSGDWLKHGIVKMPQDALATADVVFVALHGAYGEDGTVQRILNRMGVPYTGSSPYASNLSMNKIVAKEHLKQLGIKMPPHFRVTKESTSDIPRLVNTITTLFGPKYIVKPALGSATVGTLTAKSPSQPILVIEKLLETTDDLLVEKFIEGRNATCGVIDGFRGERVYAMPSTEVIFSDVSEDYISALLRGSLDHYSPGRFTKQEKEELTDLARTVHNAIGLSQYSRSDFIVASDGIYFLEANALPYLGPNSPFLSSLYSIGAHESDLIQQLLATATSNK